MCTERQLLQCEPLKSGTCTKCNCPSEIHKQCTYEFITVVDENKKLKEREKAISFLLDVKEELRSLESEYIDEQKTMEEKYKQMGQFISRHSNSVSWHSFEAL